MAEEFNSGVNVIASNVGMDITKFIESAEKMQTYLDALNTSLKGLSDIKIGAINISDASKAIDQAVLSQTNGQNKIIVANEKAAAQIAKINADRAANEELSANKVIAAKEQAEAKVEQINSQRVANEEVSNARIAQINSAAELNQQKIITEGLRQQGLSQKNELTKSENIFSNYFDKLKGMTMHHINWFITGGVLLFGGDLIKKGIVDFDSGMAGIQQTLEETYKAMNQTLGPEEMNRIAQGFSTISERWGESVIDILDAGKQWSRQYKDVEEVQNLVNNSVLLSVVDNVNLKDSVSSLEATMNQWGRTARNAAEANQFSLEIVDKWSTLAHKQMATANDLAAANAKTGSVARQVGVDFDHMQGLITASLRATGRSGDEIGNMWKSVLASIHTDKSVQELKALGVAAKDSAGNWRPVQDVLSDVMIKMAGTKQDTETLMQALAGGKWQWAKLAASLGDYDTYIKATGVSINSTGKAHEYMAAQMDTVQRKAGQLYQALISVVNAAGNGGLTGVTKNLIDELRYFVDGLNNGGIQLMAMAAAISASVNIYGKVTKAMKEAKEAQKELNTVTAVGEALTGNFAGLIAGVAVLSAAALTAQLGKQYEAEKNIVEITTASGEKKKVDLQATKDQIEVHKAMIDQYDTEISFVQELEKNRNKLIQTMNGMAESDSRKADLNKELQATEDALAEAVGNEAASNVKNANYTHTAFQSLITSLKGKQDAEKVAWTNSQKMVSEATDNLRKNIINQIDQIRKASDAYTLFGQIQLTVLNTEKAAAEQRVKYFEELTQRSPWYGGGSQAEEGLKKAKESLQSVLDEIDNLTNSERDKKIQKLISDLNALGGVASDTAIGDIPGLGDLDFKNEPMSSGSGSSSKSKSSIEQPTYSDPTDAIIRSFNAVSDLLGAREKLLQTEINEAKQAKDYAAQETITDHLFQTEQAHVNSLRTATQGLNNERNRIKSLYSFDTTKWFDANGEATNSYYQAFNSASAEAQKQMQQEFDRLQKINKAWNENAQAIQDATVSMVEAARDESLDELERAQEQATTQAQKNIDAVSDAYDAKIKDLQNTIDATSESYQEKTKELQNYIDAESKAYDAQIKAQQALIKSTGDDYDNQIQALKDNLQSVTDAYDAQIKDQQTILDNLNDQVDAENKLLELAKANDDINKAMADKRFEYINSSGNKELTYDKEKVAELTQTRDDLVRQQQQDAAKKAVQDQIDSLQAQRDAQKDLLQGQIDDLQKAKDSQNELLQAQLQTLEDAKDAENEALQEKLKNLEDEADAENKTLQGQLKNLQDAKDETIKALNDELEQTKESYQKQIDMTQGAWNDILNSVREGTDGFNKLMNGDAGWYNMTMGNLTTFGDNVKAQVDAIAGSFAKLQSMGTPTISDTGTVDYNNNSTAPINVYGAPADLANARSILGNSGYNYIDTSKSNYGMIQSGSLVVGGPNAAGGVTDADGATRLSGYDAQATRNAIQAWADAHKYHEGGEVQSEGAGRFNDLLNGLVGARNNEQLILARVGETVITQRQRDAIMGSFAALSRKGSSIPANPLPANVTAPAPIVKHYDLHDFTIKTEDPKGFFKNLNWLIQAQEV